MVTTPGTLVQLLQVPESASSDVVVGSLAVVSGHEAGGEVSVVLCDGATALVSPANLAAVPELRRPGCGGGETDFDIVLGRPTDVDAVAGEIATCIFEKGFCVVKVFSQAQKSAAVLRCLQDAGAEGNLSRLPEEVEEAYLGPGARRKVAWLLDKDASSPQHEVLRERDQLLTSLASSLGAQVAGDAFGGKPLVERTAALVSLPFCSDEEEEEYPPPIADDRTLGDFLSTWRRQILKTCWCMGPGETDVLLEPLDSVEESAALPVAVGGAVQLRAAANTLVLYRPDHFTLSTSSRDEVVVMTASFLGPALKLELGDYVGDVELLNAANSLGPLPPSQDLVSVQATEARLAANCDDDHCYETGLMAGLDTATEFPLLRFDYHLYYEPDDAVRQPFQIYMQHMGFVEGIEMFDNKYFDITNNDARGMDTMQRQVLEVGAKLLMKMGITKKDSSKKPHHAGVSVGLDKDDWDSITDKCTDASQGGYNVQAIISNRFSFLFNLKGCNFVADTACSASLCATHLSKLMLLNRWDPLDFHVALGIHQCLAMGPFIGGTLSGMYSRTARCQTFNESADGYMRADGCTGMVLKAKGFDESQLALLRASAAGQNGRSASLTAPNGVSQEVVIVTAMKEAGLQMDDIQMWNCHGTGTKLGDPIEVNAVRRIQQKVPMDDAMLMTTNKTCTGHLEGGAAMTSLIAAVFQVKHAKGLPVAHLDLLNPHLDATEFQAHLINEVAPSRFLNCHNSVSSFGFGGTNGHMIFWGKNVVEDADLTTKMLRRLQMMSPPEIRPIGADPNNWETDLPNLADMQPGDRYTILVSPDDPVDAPMRFVKESAADRVEEDLWFSVASDMAGDAQQMVAGEVPGLWTTVIEIPDSGMFAFNILTCDSEEKVLCPQEDACRRMTSRILGPAAEPRNVWIIEGKPRAEARINFFSFDGRYTIAWKLIA